MAWTSRPVRSAKRSFLRGRRSGKPGGQEKEGFAAGASPGGERMKELKNDWTETA